MSRYELLDEAIVKAKKADDWQLVEWLRMARGGEKASRWCTEKLRKLQAENTELRELVRDMCDWVYSTCQCDLEEFFADKMHELGIEVDE